MNRVKPKRKIQTLSIRIPIELYVLISQHAVDNDLPSLNASVIELIEKGGRAATDKDDIISQFILEFVPKEKIEELINGG